MPQPEIKMIMTVECYKCLKRKEYENRTMLVDALMNAAQDDGCVVPMTGKSICPACKRGEK